MALENHEKRWNSKPQTAGGPPPPPPVSPNIMNGILALDLQTDVAGVSLKVVQNGITRAQIILLKVTNWNLSARRLTIYSEDITPLVLNFLNGAEALNGLTRLETAMNGGTV